jgi:hypothetical protein
MRRALSLRITYPHLSPEDASDGEERFPEPLAECSKHLGRRSTRLLDGRDAPSAEGDVEGDDPTACNANWKEAVV